MNHNRKEKTDRLVEQLHTITNHPHDIIVIDTSDDIDEVSQYSSIRLNKNIYTTQGWLMGLHYADALERIGGYKYFSYCFLKPGVEILDLYHDVIATMTHSFIQDRDIVGVHPSLSLDSVSAWKNMFQVDGALRVQVYAFDNIFSCYRARWFNEIGRFSDGLLYGWGVDIETGYCAYEGDFKILVDNRVVIRFPGIECDVDESVAQNNMVEYFQKMYGNESKLYQHLDIRHNYDPIDTEPFFEPR